MPDLTSLAALGRASVDALWLPVGLWTVLALAVEAALRLGRSRESLALPVRGAVLAALPLVVIVPAIVAALTRTSSAVARWVPPTVQWLPDVWVGEAPTTPVASAPPSGEVLLGLAVVTVVTLAGVGLLRLARSLAEIHAMRRRLVLADAEVQAAVDHARQRLGVGRSVWAVVAPAGAAPFTLGVRSPLVALPPGLGAEARALAAVHEIAHVRRADYGWHLAQRVLTALFGAHPLVRTMARGLDLDRERAADALVLDACPGRRRSYADLLFSYAALPAPTLALGAVDGSSSLKTRIDAMTSPLSPSRARLLARWGRLGGLLALVVATGLAATVAPALPAARGLTFQLVDPVYEIDGQPLGSNGGSFSDDAFGFYVLEVDGVGRFVVAAEPFSGSTPTGTFGIQSIRAEADGHTLFIRSAKALFPNGGAPETAHVRFEAASGPASALGGFTESLPHTLDDLGPVGAESPMGALVALAAGMTEAATVEGRVTDASTGAPISGATVSIPNTAIGAATDEDGRYVLQAPDDARSVSFAAPGYVSKLLPLADGQGRLDVTLAPLGSREGIPATGEVSRSSDAPRPDVFEVVENQPQLIGGVDALVAAVQYPPLAREAGIAGRVIVQFVVDTDGSVIDPVVVRSPHEMLSQAALEAVQRLRFTPGSQAGEAVKVRFALPIVFALPESEDPDSDGQ